MKPEIEKRLNELAKKHPTYPTQDEALLALFKKTQWDAGIYLSIFPTGDGRFYFTMNEKEALETSFELEEKGINYYAVVDDGSDKKLEKKLTKFYKDEMRVEFDKYVPQNHPEYKALWKACSSDLGEFANGLGGFCSPKYAAKDKMEWFRKSKKIWVDVITEAFNSDEDKLPAKQAAKLIKEYTKGKTAQECSGLSMEEWMKCKIHSQGDLEQFAGYWVCGKSMIGLKFTGKPRNFRTAKIVKVKNGE